MNPPPPSYSARNMVTWFKGQGIVLRVSVIGVVGIGHKDIFSFLSTQVKYNLPYLAV